MVLGSIIGVGIFNLPASLAAFGPISLVALILTTVGAAALALMFASLATRMPAGGGPYAYARAGFGNTAGFVNAWLYWLTAWGGNAAIATGWVLYVERFVNTDHNKIITIILTLAGLWLAVGINLFGLQSMGRIQLWTSVLKFVPLLLISTVGLAFIDPANFRVWNLSGQSNLAAVGGAMALCLFSYIGVESASVAAGQVREPRRNIPRATVLGTGAAAVVYLLSLVTVFGVVPSSELAESSAPFAAAATDMTGASWVGAAVAALVVISGFGALNGWTMLSAEMPRAAAQDGLFPARFNRLSNRGVPAFGIVMSGLLALGAGDPLPHRRAGHHRLQHADPHDRYSHRHRVRVLGPRADQMATQRSRDDPGQQTGRRSDHGDDLTRVVSAVRGVLHRHAGHRFPGVCALRLPAGCGGDQRADLPPEPVEDDRAARAAS